MVGASAISAPAASFSIFPRTKSPSLSLFSHRRNSVVSALPRPYSDSSTRLSLRIDEKGFRDAKQSYVTVEAKGGNPPIMPAVMTPGGPMDLSSVLFRNRIIFIGQPINSQVAQRVISQLVTLATIDEKTDILLYLNCPGGSTYSVLAIYDCMSWIKPKVGTVCFGVAASQGALLLSGGEKGMRYAMPNARIMIHQPQGGCGVRIDFQISLMLLRGHVEDVRRQVNEAVQARHKIDQMYATFTGQPLEKVQQYTERDRFLSTSEAMEFGLIDGILETEY
ncbi:hypothetical protein NC652_011549 [Populus alba x Populus x berolinensis]|uniref:Endopeptidase Clp n=1 Tax=Populus tomentosa TaxID=118781 RepID=A0A8X7ZYE6_POPTO|nr:hypothetical protein POTOM_015892 [Populus tomentosa]KAJ6936893.1 hypothetical protein NC652_011549 [Populus alba x Populus x berolinensis]